MSEPEAKPTADILRSRKMAARVARQIIDHAKEHGAVSAGMRFKLGDDEEFIAMVRQEIATYKAHSKRKFVA